MWVISEDKRTMLDAISLEVEESRDNRWVIRAFDVRVNNCIVNTFDTDTKAIEMMIAISKRIDGDGAIQAFGAILNAF